MATHTLDRPTGPLTSLRGTIQLDAAVSATFGVALLIAANPLADVVGLSAGWLRGIGAFALLYGADLALLARHLPGARRFVGLVVAGNSLWVAASLVLAIVGDLTGLGRLLVVAQAVIVADLAWLQARALRVGQPSSRT